MAITIIGEVTQASSGQDITILADITDAEGAKIARECFIELWQGNNAIYKANGAYNGEIWAFTIPADVTIDLHGRFFYAISNNEHNLCEIKPIYII